MNLFLLSLICYLLGSVSFGYIAIKLRRGEDIREIGTGNAGTTNTWRATESLPLTLLVGIGDLGKGVFSVLLSTYFFPGSPIAKAIAAFFVVVGHNWSIFLLFDLKKEHIRHLTWGGHGVATALGTYLIGAPLAIPIGVAVWFLTYLLTDYLAVGIIPAVFVILGSYFYMGRIPFIVWSTAVPILIPHFMVVKEIWEEKIPKNFWTLE